jgi:hypothetical protein
VAVPLVVAVNHTFVWFCTCVQDAVPIRRFTPSIDRGQ